MKQHAIKNTPFPVYIPGNDGELKLEIATASLKAGTLVVEFNDRLPAQAIQRMIANERLVGLAVVVLDDQTPTEDPSLEKEKN